MSWMPPPNGPMYPSRMNDVQSVVVGRARPLVLDVAAWLWVVSALVPPFGVLVRELVVGADPAYGERLPWFLLIVVVFGLFLLAIAEVWLAMLMRGGNWYARLTLAFVTVLLEVVAVVQLIGAAGAGIGYSGAAAGIAWAVLVLRVVVPPVPFVLAFLPVVNGYLGATR